MELLNSNLGQSVVLQGPYGIGKMDKVLWYATQALGCDKDGGDFDHPDLMVVDALPQKNVISLEQIKEAGTFLQTSPMYGKEKFLIFDHADFINDEGQNALLKVVEEPSKSSRIFFVSSFDKILPTISSRCQILTFGELDLPKDLSWEDLAVLNRDGLKNKIKRDKIRQQKYLDSMRFFCNCGEENFINISDRLSQMLEDDQINIEDWVFAWYAWLRIVLLEKMFQKGYDIDSDFAKLKTKWLSAYDENFLVTKMYELEESLNLILFSNVKNDIILENYLLGFK